MQMKTNLLIKLGECLKELGICDRATIANTLHLSLSEFDLFCDQISELCTREDLVDDFEGKVHDYICEQFYDADSDWQKTILTSVLSNFTDLDAGTLNECLDKTELPIVAHKLEIPDEVICDVQ